MKARPETHTQEHSDIVSLYVLQALPQREIAAAEAQIASCAKCAQEVAMLRPITQSFAGWPTDVLRPAESLWGRLARRIAGETGDAPFVPGSQAPAKPQWEQAAPGIHVQILAVEPENDRVSMLVRLDPGTDYPAHMHAGVEELHLLHGILKVDDKTYYPGDYLRSEPGSVDRRVWTETGCTCFLMTSTKDSLL